MVAFVEVGVGFDGQHPDDVTAGPFTETLDGYTEYSTINKSDGRRICNPCETGRRVTKREELFPLARIKKEGTAGVL